MSYHILQLCALILFVNGEYVIVNSKQGDLKGQAELSRGGRPFYAFYGIPYAEPPLGDLRLENPVPPTSWNGVRDATILPPPCLSILEDGEIYGDEDCLYLNLYTPKLTNETLLPVIIFTYGGGFMFGDALPSKYGPQYFMDKDIILITYHYRLGALGFLSTGDDVLPGNYGLKDLVALLHWVQENIEAYGGDKNRVTLAGGSSGGMASALALVSPLIEGLFHRGIFQSGNRFTIVEQKQARKGAWKLASYVNCSDDNVITSQDLKLCLKKLPARTVISKQLSVKAYLGPVIEDENMPDAFLVDDPVKLLSRKSDIPWIIGMNSADGGMEAIFTYYSTTPGHMSAKEVAANYKTHFAHLANSRAGIVVNSKDNRITGWCYTNIPVPFSGLKNVSTEKETQLHLKTVTGPKPIRQAIREYFFGDSDISRNAQGYSKMVTVLTYLPVMKTWADLYRGPLYAYYYNHRNEETFAGTYGDPKEDMGVIHGDELISMFNWSQAITPVTKGIDLLVSEQMLTLWSNFATFGDPNGNDKIIWEPVKSKKIEHLYLKNGLEMKEELLAEESEFLEKLQSIASTLR